jgi:hypothetical protein
MEGDTVTIGEHPNITVLKKDEETDLPLPAMHELSGDCDGR